MGVDFLRFGLTMLRWVLLGPLLLPPALVLADDPPTDEPPERARDLAYGEAVFDYYQGDSFNALTRLAVAEARGGIQGHGEHPELLRGGMMLGYGMTRSAKAIFERLLDERSDARTRSQAWFYLGKTFYLERDMAAASDALTRVDPAELELARADLLPEWHYLRGQVALASGDTDGFDAALAALPQDSLWASYLRINAALLQSTGDAPSEAAAALERARRLQTVPAIAAGSANEDEREEALSLADNLSLAEAGYRLDAGDFDGAIAAFRQIRLDSPFSDQALYGLALAATENRQYGLALGALKRLQERPLFNPWLRQVPYATAYLYEAMEQPRLASDAYNEAANVYRALYRETDAVLNSLNEETLLNALLVSTEEGEDARSLQETGGAPRDSHGRLKVHPAEFQLARRLSSEAFQLALRDLFELRQMASDLERWQEKIKTFRIMIENRQALKSRKSAETEQALSQQQAEEWKRQQEAFQAGLDQALEAEDAYFFLDEELLAHREVLDSVRSRLEAMPEGPEKDAFSEQFRRVNGYFVWLANDRYGVNRWAVEKAQKGLVEASEEYEERRARLNALLASDSENQAYLDRLQDVEGRLSELMARVGQRLKGARDDLLAMAREDLEAQRDEIRHYALLSQKAHARLLDEAYRRTEVAP